jgi:hypothetical protein
MHAHTLSLLRITSVIHNLSLKLQQVAVGPCPSCGATNRVFFGDVLGIEVSVPKYAYTLSSLNTLPQLQPLAAVLVCCIILCGHESLLQNTRCFQRSVPRTQPAALSAAY